MVAEARIVKITPEITANDLLDDADDAPVIVERDGVRYRVMRETQSTDVWADYDPEKAIAALHELAGVWSEYDTDTMIEDIYDARERGTRPVDRP